jgi:outer membrane protein
MPAMRARIFLIATALLLVSLDALSAQPPEAAASAGADAAAGNVVTLTAAQAVTQARTNQPLIQQALAAVEAARARIGEAQSAYYPMVNGTASYNRLSDESFSIASVLPSFLASQVPSQYKGLLAAPFSLVPLNSWDFNLGVNQVITQFGKRDVQVKLAESALAAARIGVDQVTTMISYQAAQVFYTALFLQEQGKALDAQYQNLQEHLQVILVREQTGSATRLEDLSTQVRIAALQSQRADVESQLQKQKIALRQLIGVSPSTEIALSGSFDPGPAPAGDASLVDSALQKRPDLHQAVEAESAAGLNQKLAAVGWRPTVSAHASVGFKNGALPDINPPVFNWVAGVQVSVPIFQGFLWARSQEEAGKKLEGARKNTSAVRLNATTQVLQAAQDVRTARQQVEISAGALDKARQMVDVAKVQYDIGVISNLEYLDAQTALETASVSNLAAMYKEVLSEYALRQAAGETLPD